MENSKSCAKSDSQQNPILYGTHPLTPCVPITPPPLPYGGKHRAHNTQTASKPPRGLLWVFSTLWVTNGGPKQKKTAGILIKSPANGGNRVIILSLIRFKVSSGQSSMLLFFILSLYKKEFGLVSEWNGNSH